LCAPAALALADKEEAAAAAEASIDDGETTPIILIHNADPRLGADLFVTKGCVICHSVNGVGGQAAPMLDARLEAEPIDLMDFVARMWAGAYAMSELQAIELGYQIELSGQELGHLAAFATTPKAQETFSIDRIPEPMRDWLLDQPYWEEEEWPERFEQGDFGGMGN
ncbi:MAG: hypothetical protein AAGL49_15375, partial [Pseudomonadota bacterium]